MNNPVEFFSFRVGLFFNIEPNNDRSSRNGESGRSSAHLKGREVTPDRSMYAAAAAFADLMYNQLLLDNLGAIKCLISDTK